MNEDTLMLDCCSTVQELKINIREDDMWEAYTTECGCKRELGKIVADGVTNGESDLVLQLKFVPVDEL